MSERLESALRVARDTRECVIGEGVLAEVPAIISEQFPGTGAAVVVADPRTWQAAGAQVAALLRAPHVLLEDDGLYAEMRYVDRVAAALARHPDAVPVAVGSGTINDLVKLAAHRLHRPYAAVTTAASMDGYSAYGASITDQGAKQTFACPAPRVIVADLAVLRRAPQDMTASGYADLFSKIVAGADWMLADALGVEAIDARAWHIVQDGLPAALDDPAAVREGRSAALHDFVEGLMLGGFAMQALQSSRPASGAEHQFSHLWDMEHHTVDGRAPSHGFKVGVATHFIAGVYERLRAVPLDRLDTAACCAAWPAWPEAEARARRLYAGTPFPELGVVETRAKYIDRDALAAQLERLKRVWPELKVRLAAQLLPAREVARRLRLAGAPAEPEEIGISRERMAASVLKAQHTRRRFTVLDLVLRTHALPIFGDDNKGAE